MNTAEKIDYDNLPPMLRNYLEYQEKYPDCLLLYQVGDFYETFFDNAVTISKALNLTLTSRSKNADVPVPLAGVPIAVMDTYLERLIKQGYSVAVVSQFESKDAKNGVDRKLERIVTPGVTVQCNLEGAETNFVAALSVLDEEGEHFSLAFSSVQSGVLYVRELLDRPGMLAELQKLSPAELILPKEAFGTKLDKRFSWIRSLEKLLHTTSLKFRNMHYAESNSRVADLTGYATLGVAAKKALRLLVDYVDETTVEAQLPFSRVEVYDIKNVMSIDASARRTLELVQNSKDGSSAGSLFSVLNRTVTVGGARLLREWLLAPSTELDVIKDRQDVVAWLLDERLLSEELQESLRYISDFERLAARIELNIASPRELGALRDSLTELPKFREKISTAENLPKLLKKIVSNLNFSPELLDELLVHLAVTPPPNTKEGGIFKQGADPELDRLKNIREKGHSWIAELEAKEREATGISSLKIRYNNIQGFYIEVTKANLAKVPENYIKKQSTVNAERFITKELKEMEEEVLGASEKLFALERDLFEKLRDALKPYCPQFRALYLGLSEVDVLLSLSEVASAEGYVRPEVVESKIFDVKDGRHPVVAQLLKGSFIANSLSLSEEKSCVMLTGPNMGGKSTYLRQTGLIAVMAQIGSFVPASEAKLGIVDKLFARMGASDDLLEGESTFMVEMREAAHIVTNATERSLLLIDEIGRGTATSDGMAIARAILEWVLEKIGCRTLFATHFHELTEMDCYHDVLQNLSVGVVEENGDIYFTHAICEGAANKSYGLEVAKLAGLPAGLLTRARSLLNEKVEQPKHTKVDSSASMQYSLFPQTVVETKVVPPADYQNLKDLQDELKSLDLNAMTPIEALNYLYSIKGKVNEVA